MRILIDFRVCQYNQERGIQRYVRNLFGSVAAQLSGGEFFILQSRRGRAAPLPGALRRAAIIYDDGDVPPIDVFAISHYFDYNACSVPSPLDFMLPPPVLAHKPRVLGVLFDLIPLIYPTRYITREFERWLYILGSNAAHVADHNFAISECTKSDFVRLIGLPAEKISVLPGGIEMDRWTGVAARNVRQENQALFVGAGDFRKNIEGCIRGFALYLRRRRSLTDARLVIVCGLSVERRQALEALSESLGLEPGQVLFTGAVSDDELDEIMAASKGTIFPSLYEGLGLPILESYAAGRPAFASDCSSMRELTHPACRMDPNSVESIADAFGRLFERPGIGADSVRFGQALLASIGWEKSARRVIEHLARF